MNVVEAVILVVVFIAVVSLALQNFYTTTTGYVALIQTRASLIADALAAGQKALYKPSGPPLLKIKNTECLITPYYTDCCSLGDGVKYFVASGFPALLIDASLYGYDERYYLLVPSPSYMIRKDAAQGANPLTCMSQADNSPATAFLVLPNGTVLVRP